MFDIHYFPFHKRHCAMATWFLEYGSRWVFKAWHTQWSIGLQFLGQLVHIIFSVSLLATTYKLFLEYATIWETLSCILHYAALWYVFFHSNKHFKYTILKLLARLYIYIDFINHELCILPTCYSVTLRLPAWLIW